MLSMLSVRDPDNVALISHRVNSTLRPNTETVVRSLPLLLIPYLMLHRCIAALLRPCIAVLLY